MTKVTVSGKTVEEAVDQAVRQLNANRDQVKVTVLEEPSRGFLGIFGGKEARVEVRLPADPIRDAIQFLTDVTEEMSLDVSLQADQAADHVLISISGRNLGILIGRRGQTLDALQYLTNIVANQHHTGHQRFVLDAENYRKRRQETLEKLAERLAYKVKRSRRDIRLEPMSPLERKIIHTHVQKLDGVTTYSEGNDPNRRVVITLTKRK